MLVNVCMKIVCACVHVTHKIRGIGFQIDNLKPFLIHEVGRASYVIEQGQKLHYVPFTAVRCP